MLLGKNILIGISGGIAAYKICQLVRNFIKQGANVKVVMTPHSKEFVTPMTLSTLSKNKVYSEEFNQDDWSPEHISLADEADIFVLAPATANTIGKVATGVCDNLLTSLLCAFNKPVVFAPAMNCNMWENETVQKNIQTLLTKGFEIVEPTSGELACGYEGVGRMAEIDVIEAKVVEVLERGQFLKDKKIVITAGGTKEELDPVRYIGNYSSGKMGIALADEAHFAGAEVELITTVKVDRCYKITDVKSALAMQVAVNSAMEESDVLIMAAAVADYRPKERVEQKMKKAEALTVEFVKNPDIVAEVAQNKNSNQTIIGFAAESENVIEYAKGKIQSKKLDYIVANDISKSDIGFGSNENEVVLIDKDFNEIKIEKDSKNKIAKKILKAVFDED